MQRRTILLKVKICFLLAFGLPGLSMAQHKFFNNPAFTISVFNHSVGVPFKDYFKKPINIGVALGAEFGYGGKLENKQFQKLEIGFYRHRHLNTAVWMKTDFIRRFINDQGMYAEVQAGLGYIRDFGYLEKFEITETGSYQRSKKNSKGGLLIGAGFGAGYNFEVNDNYMVSPYIRYEGLIQLPYAKILPFFPHSLLHLGTRFRMLK